MVRVMRVRVFANYWIRWIFVTHRQFGARSLLTHFCVIRGALKQRLTEVSGLIDEYIESGGKRDFAEIIENGLNEEGNEQVQYVHQMAKLF